MRLFTQRGGRTGSGCRATARQSPVKPRPAEPVLAAHGWEGLLPELHARSLRGDWAGMASLITDEMMGEFAISAEAGDFASLGRRLRERYGDLLDRTALYTPYPVKLSDEDARGLIAGVRG